MPINLAPNHKQGLVLPNPVLLAGGTVGYGDAIHRGVQTERLGGVVVGPLMLHSRAGTAPPRLVAMNGGFVLNTGLQNRGVGGTLKKIARIWPRLGCPVIAQVADSQPDALSRVLERLLRDSPKPDTISGVELLIPEAAEAERTRALVEAVTHGSDFPVWAKLPLHRCVELAQVAVEAGADALVIGQPPAAAGIVRHGDHAPAQGVSIVRGALYGPLAFPQMLNTLLAIVAQQLPCPLIACGGIHTLEQAQQVLDAGASALQVDSAVWVEPGLPGRLVSALTT